MANSAKAKETIRYDEYMNSGIPDSLLEGLGFFRNNEMDNEDCDGSEIGAYSNVPRKSLPRPSSNSLSRVRNHQMPKSLSNPAASPSQNLVQSSAQLMSPQQHVSPPTLPVRPNHGGVALSSSSSGRGGGGGGGRNSKIVIKGNIMYERTETGEVIASVIRNGIPKLPSADVAVSPSSSESRQVSSKSTASKASSSQQEPANSTPAHNAASGPRLPPVGVPTPRGRPLGTTDAFRANPYSEKSSPSGVFFDCPIDENNVEIVLEQSINATQTMRRTLISLKDDLRRMGGGPAVTPALRPIHLQHRLDVSQKLSYAFAEYRKLIAKISNEPEAVELFNARFPETTGADKFANAYLQRHHQQQQRSAYRQRESLPAKTISHEPSPATVTVKPKGETVTTFKRKAAHSPAAIPAASLKRKVDGDQESIISDDLLMSCEPCD